MNYSLVAPVYRWVERMVFGECLQRARVVMLKEAAWDMAEGPRVLVVGGGDGRVLPELLARLPDGGCVDFLEPSEGMMVEARRLVLAGGRVRWLVCSLEEWLENAPIYDAVCMQFFLDGYPQEVGVEVVGVVCDQCLSDGGLVCVADFDPDVAWWARVWVWVMQGFFLCVAGVKPVRFAKVDKLMPETGMKKLAEDLQLGGFIYASIWKKV